MVPDKELELAWAAGFFDGEGSCCVHRYSHKRGDKVFHYKRARILLSQSGDDGVELLERWADAVGVPRKNIFGPYDRGHKPVYQLHIYKTADVRKVIDLLTPYLSPVKRMQAENTYIEVEAFDPKAAVAV